MSGWGLVRSRARLADTIVAGAATALSLICLVPLYADLQWVLPAVLVVLVVAALGAGARAIALPIPLVPIVEGLGIIATITALFAADQAGAKMLPTSEAWDTLRYLLQLGMSDAATYSAPVPTMPQLVLLAVGGAGLAALSIDTLYVCVRSPILAGLPILTLYVGSALLLFGRAPWWQFPPAAAAWLLLLAADQRERIREWGGLDESTRILGLSPIARRTGLAVIVIAMLAAAVLPGRGLAPWRAAGNGSGDPVGAAPVVLDPLVSMRRDLIDANDTEVLKYRTQNPSPSYLRVAALESFDGVTWSPRAGLTSKRVVGIPLPGNIMDELPEALPEYHVRGGASYNYLFSVTSLENSYLPLPYPITSLAEVSGLKSDWYFDPGTGVAYSEGKPATGLRYGVTALDPQTKSSDLRAGSAPDGRLWPQLSVPSSISPVVRQLATQVTKSARTPYDKAVALQRWFTRDGGFSYSTSVRSGADADYLTEFLNDRVGYCEQFAAAMALMARTLGIPARVVVGFTQGRKGPDGTWTVTVRDAHAWPELWFDGVGWTRFEPTPRSDATVTAPDYAPDAATSTQGRSGDERRGVLDVDGFTPVQVADRTSGVTVPVAVAVLTLLALIAAIPMARRVVRRRRRLGGRDYDRVILGAWEEIGDSAVDLGQPWSVFRTPRQASERLSRGMPEPAAAALRRLRVQVEQVRYGPGRGDDVAASLQAERSGAVRADVHAVRAELLHRVRWQTRLSAYCWPPSLRRRQRSSSRSISPGDFGVAGAGGAVPAASSAGRTENAE
jgi:transglutaminase-like putative cysteine protease